VHNAAADGVVTLSGKISQAKIVEVKDLVETANGVYYSPYPLPIIDAGIIEFLKLRARATPQRRARFCAHQSADVEQHEMLIVSHRDTYIAPHRHFDKLESFVILEGLADIILFDERGRVEKIVKMGPPSSSQPFFYFMPPRQFHSLSIETELLVFLESTKGPFRKQDCEHAAWAPDAADNASGRLYIEAVLRETSGAR
jgi:cupin fold WbuC family metalloprotein